MSRKLTKTILILSMSIILVLSLIGCSVVKAEGNLAKNLSPTQGQGMGTQSDPLSLIDGKSDTKWIGDASSKGASVKAIFTFNQTTKFNMVALDEDGRKITAFNIRISKGNADSKWTTIFSGKSLADLEHQGVIILDKPVEADRIMIEITDSDGKFGIKEMGIYLKKIDEQETEPKD